MNQSVLGVLERPKTAWLAQHMTPGDKPDHLTFPRFSGAMLMFVGNLLVLAFGVHDVAPMVSLPSRFVWVSVPDVVILALSGN